MKWVRWMLGEERCCQKQQLWIQNTAFNICRRTLSGPKVPCLKKNCRQNFIWLLNISLYLPYPFNFLPSWHSQVQGQQWALITSKSYNCVVFIFEYLTLNHTPLSTIYNCLQKTIQSYIFLTSENQTTCFAKSVKPNSVQRKRHQMVLFKITILTYNFRYDEVFRLYF